jgi:hypothetical protein
MHARWLTIAGLFSQSKKIQRPALKLCCSSTSARTRKFIDGENPFIHQAVLRLVSQGKVTAQRCGGNGFDNFPSLD